MRVFLLHRKVPSLTKIVQEFEARELIKKALARVKAVDMISMTEKVKSATRKSTIRERLSADLASPLSSPIRILLEEVKRRVRVLSPEAKLFIGPGD